MKKYYVTAVISNPLLRIGKIGSEFDNIKNFVIKVESGLVNHEVFKEIIRKNNPQLFEYPANIGKDQHLLPKSDMKIISWSLIEEV